MRVAYIAEDSNTFDSAFDCQKYEKDLEKKKEEAYQREVQRCSDAFLLSVGFDLEKHNTEIKKNQALGITWLIFDKYGNVRGLKTSGGGLMERHGIKCDFRYVSSDDKKDPETMENWLRKNRLYGHQLSSFTNRHPDFYKKNLLEKLETLDWEIENGEILNTAW